MSFHRVPLCTGPGRHSTFVLFLRSHLTLALPACCMPHRTESSACITPCFALWLLLGSTNGQPQEESRAEQETESHVFLPWPLPAMVLFHWHSCVSGTWQPLAFPESPSLAGFSTLSYLFALSAPGERQRVTGVVSGYISILSCLLKLLTSL